MSLHQSLRRLFGRSLRSTSNRAKPSRRRPTRFERLEGRALLTGVSGDFDGDGFDDLAVGIPSDNVDGKDNTGSVQIIYGSPEGLTATNTKRFHLESSGIDGTAVGGEKFGSALAVGDFDGDGYDDLAIGAPHEDVGGVEAGVVHILYGSRFGLRSNGSQRIHQNSSGVNGIAAAGDLFGAALAAGDFDNDGRDDLAIGTPGEDVDGLNNAGAVSILYGRKDGLSAKGDQQWTSSTTGVDGVAEVDGQFGYSLATGDFDGDGRDDLAVGVIGQTIGGVNDAGAVYIMYGSSSDGLRVSGDQYRHLGNSDVLGKLTADGEFGFALAAGDFNDDSRDDLAVGSPGENISLNNTPQTSGSVHVFYGGKNGTKITGNQKWDKFNSSTPEAPVDTDRYGAALAVGQINRNRQDDLIIGVPGNTVSGAVGAGTIRVLYGSANGLAGTGTQSISQSSATGLGTPEANDGFGRALGFGDYNGDGLGDVAVGVPSDQNDANVAVGSVNVFYGTASNLSTTDVQLWLQGVGGLTGTPEAGDEFGGAL